MYIVGRQWDNPETGRTEYIMYCGYASFSMWTTIAFNASTMPYALAQRIAQTYGAEIIQLT